jgi:hypothetical protein
LGMGSTSSVVVSADVRPVRRIWPITSDREVGWENNGSQQPNRLGPRAAGGMRV